MSPPLPRRALLAAPLSALVTGPAGAQTPALKELAAARGIRFGAMVANYQLQAQPGLWPLTRREADFIVPGLELKWQHLRPAPDRFDFSGADALLARAEAAGMGLRAHTLVWHEALPRWFEPAMPAAQMRRLVQTHIRTVAGRYAGKVLAWDVVNEAIEPYDKRDDGLRASPFLRVLGTEYVRLVLEWAAEADPKARLVINDYNLEQDNAAQDDRRAAMLRLLEGLVRRKVPLHGLGLQAHLGPRVAPFSAEKLRRFLREVAALGLEISITELDVVDRLLPGETAARDAEVAAMYRDFLAVALEEKAVTLLAVWGLADSQGWQDASAFHRRKDGLPARGHPYDRDLQPKPARQAIAAALREAPRP